VKVDIAFLGDRRTRDLAEAVRAKTFAEDLLYRLNGR
jgi:transcriptional regulator with GAF, ATPase, and Fis domain